MRWRGADTTCGCWCGRIRQAPARDPFAFYDLPPLAELHDRARRGPRTGAVPPRPLSDRRDRRSAARASRPRWRTLARRCDFHAGSRGREHDSAVAAIAASAAGLRIARLRAGGDWAAARNAVERAARVARERTAPHVARAPGVGTRRRLRDDHARRSRMNWSGGSGRARTAGAASLRRRVSRRTWRMWMSSRTAHASMRRGSSSGAVRLRRRPVRRRARRDADRW